MVPPPPISVVIPCFNGERYIAAALGSVAAQRWPEHEVIVVDDGSTDGSVQRVREQFPQVKLLQQPNAGVAAARNLGVRHARHDWIAFLDADDVWLPGKLQAQWQMLQQQPAARMAYNAWHEWDSSDAEPLPSLLAELAAAADDTARWAGPTGWIYPEMLLDCQVWTSTVLVQRSLLAELGGFDAELRIGEDYDLWLRASQATPILRVARPLALYRKHAGSVTQTVAEKNFKDVVISRAIAKWGYASPDGRRANKADVDRALALSWSNYASTHLWNGRLAHARHGSLMSIRTDWAHGRGWRLLAKSLLRSLAPQRAQPR